MTFLLKFAALLAARGGRGLLGCLFLAASAAAQAAPDAESASPDLYRDAMLAITEGRLEDAEKALVRLTAAEPLHSGARLDLAMLYCAAGNAAATESLFTEIEQRFSPPQPILDVIAHQRKLGCAGWQPKNDVTLRLGSGFESNVNQGASSPNFSIGSGAGQINLVLLPDYRPRSDAFTNFSAEWARDLSPGGATGVFQFQSRRYGQLSDYNTNSVFLGAAQPWRWGGWGLRAAGTTGLMTLDNRLYLKQNQLQMEVAPPLPLPTHWRFGMTGSWSTLSYPTLSGFDARWWETRATLDYRKEDVGWQASASNVQDRASGNRPGGDRVGMFAGLQGRMGLGRGVIGEWGWQWQRWQGSRDYFPGLINVRRLQDTQTLRAAAIFPLSVEHAVVLEIRDTRNHENISIFSYRDRIVQLIWQWQPVKKQ